MIMHIQSPTTVKKVYSNIFKDISTFSVILMHIQPHSQARNYGREGRRPPLFLKIERSVLIFKRRALIVSIFGLNFKIAKCKMYF